MCHGREVVGRFMVVLILACPLALLGAEPEFQGPKTTIASMEVQATRIDWHPKVDYERLVLTVAGPDDSFIHQVFEAGQAPQLSLVNSKGDRLADGSYAYELRAVQCRGGKLPEQLLVQSGYLSVQEGNFVDTDSARHSSVSRKDPDSTPPPRNATTKDIVQNDDLIVHGHACIGESCSSGDADGVTLILKDPLIRVLFDDVVDGLTYTGDWMFEINGIQGADISRFSVRDYDNGLVPFTLSAGAPDHSLYVRSNGNLGLGTSTPAVRLDVKANVTGQGVVRLQNSSATGYSNTEYLDNAGNLDLSFGVDNLNSIVRLDTMNNNPFVILTNFTERMRVSAAGNVGIGTSNPGARLEVAGGEVRFPPGSAGLGFTHFNLPSDGKNYIRGTTIIADNGGTVGIGTTTPAKRLTIKSGAGNDDVMQVVKSSGATSIFRIFETTSGDGLFSVFDNAGSEATRFTSVSGGKLAIGCNTPEHRLDLGSSAGSACWAGFRSFIDAGSTTFTASSSRFIKENLKPVEIENVLDRISEVKVYNYDFIEGPKDKVGLMAEDFHTIFGRGSDKMLDGQEVEMALWLAVQELTAENRELKAHNQELAARNEEFEKRLADIEARLAAGHEDMP